MSRMAVLVAFLVMGALLAGGGTPALAGWDNPQTRLTANGSGIAWRPPAADYGRGRLEVLPTYQAEAGKPFQMDLRGYDLSELVVVDRLGDLVHADFDDRTTWPKALPAGFDPARVMELGKNPGLGVRSLQAKGIAGKGVGIGIIDQGLLVDHKEYVDRLKLYEEIHCGDEGAQMHGPAVASIAVGKTVGVAPEADLYYIAETHVRPDMPMTEGVDWWKYVDFGVTAQAIDRLLEINRALPKEHKIRVISISVGWSPGNGGYDEVMAAVKRATEQNVFVISTALERTHKLAFHGLNRAAMADPEKVASYTAATWGRNIGGGRLLIPMGGRTTASPTGVNDYVHYDEGGWSWVVPYVAGLYAMACQVKPDITPEEFWQKALETGDELKATPVKTAAAGPAEGGFASMFRARTTSNGAFARFEFAMIGLLLAAGLGLVAMPTGRRRRAGRVMGGTAVVLALLAGLALMGPGSVRSSWAGGEKQGPSKIVNPVRLMQSLQK